MFVERKFESALATASNPFRISCSTMGNPAEHLAQIFESWGYKHSQTTAQARGGSGGAESIEFWRQHARAVQLLGEIETCLDALEAGEHDVTHFREALPAWYGAVFSYQHGWTQGVQHDRSVLAPGDLRLLKSLGTLMRFQDQPVLASDGVAQLEVALDAARELIDTDPRLHDGVRQYLAALIGEVRDCASQIDRYGETPARSATFRLTGAMQFAASRSLDPDDAEARKKWATVVQGLLLPFLAGATGQIASAAVRSLLGLP
ncbi:hypothetical protein [Amycolatopsis thermoflava]|uniref:hypothetical protein n=1 Tax=Amycolatopsis thermoflava TaxID=84480 RepID=UPI003EBBD7B9